MGEIVVKTRWLRSDSDDSESCPCCEGKHVFAYASDIQSSDYPSRYASQRDLYSHVHRAISSFPEGAEIRISFEQIERKDEQRVLSKEE